MAAQSPGAQTPVASQNCWLFRTRARSPYFLLSGTVFGCWPPTGVHPGGGVHCQTFAAFPSLTKLQVNCPSASAAVETITARVTSNSFISTSISAMQPSLTVTH